MSEPSKLDVPRWTKKSFELGNTIHKFTTDFLARNRSREPTPTRQEVELHWTWQVLRAYPDSGDPKRIYLLDQLSCPVAQILWEKREDEEAFRAKRAKQMQSGFHLITRDRTQHEQKEYASAAIMTHAVHGDVIVPDVVLYPLRKISYLDLVPKILEANPTKDLDHSVTHELWDAILTKIYDYEYDWREAKKHEAKSATTDEYFELLTDMRARSSKRKHSEIEEGSVVAEASSTKTKQASGSAQAAAPQESLSIPDAGPSNTKGKAKAMPAKDMEATTSSNALSSARKQNEQKAESPSLFLTDDEDWDPEAQDRALGGSGSAPIMKDTVPESKPAKATEQTRPDTFPLAPSLAPPKPTPSSSTSTRPHAPAPAPPPSSFTPTPRPPRPSSDDTPPWPYDPTNGRRTARTSVEYILSEREQQWLSRGIPPWAFDPRTGERTEIMRYRREKKERRG